MDPVVLLLLQFVFSFVALNGQLFSRPVFFIIFAPFGASMQYCLLATPSLFVLVSRKADFNRMSWLFI